MTDPALVISSVLLNELHPILPIASSERIKSSLDILWVSHIRCLAQALHEVLGSHTLGSTKVGAVGNAGMVEYYIPGTATMTFAMAECLWSGSDTRETPCRRSEWLVDALAVLQSHMILRPAYIHHESMPRFSSNTISPSAYGVGQRTKADQVHQAREGVLHKFGARLLPVDEMFIPTRSNTPDNDIPVAQDAGQ
ncbi:hypothetical protein B0H10DRAFT_1943094 [Mycena sp. CBHHK59/15]|nr:hypothetical protein B0H10DRAFT_1943094 [Mycena sp. CBHHK59/15]